MSFTRDPLQPTLALTQSSDELEHTLRGVVQSVSFTTADGTFSVAKLLAGDGREYTVVGDIGSTTPGEHVRVTGVWQEHKTHGRQMRAETVVPELPTTPQGIARLLGSGFVDGIGPLMAKRIVALFGSATLDVIADHPERLREVEGIGKTRAKRIQETFRARRAEVEQRAFLQAVGIGPALMNKVQRKYGEELLTVVKGEPYRLANDIPGVGFATADRIAKAVGIKHDDPRRAEAAVRHLVLEGGDSGHTALPKSVLNEGAASLQIPIALMEAAVERLIEGSIIIRDQELAYHPALYYAETFIAKNLWQRVNAKLESVAAEVWTKKSVQTALKRLSETQRTAVETVMQNALFVLTGGPGTGKTTTVRAIVALAQEAGFKLTLCAPTGRAAKRLSEATLQAAGTIHRLLEYNPKLRRFMRNAESPLDTDMVLVDESSMLDVPLAAKLLEAMPAHARVVFVGDSEQLPSVGPGTVLADLLATPWIPHARLTEIFRQDAASAIVKAAHRILHGQLPEVSPSMDGSSTAELEGQFYWIKADDAARGLELCVEMVTRRIPARFAVDPITRVQMLVPTHKGPLGTVSLNQALQQVLNPEAKGARFTVGDKVMQRRNDYELEVFNGDLGTIKHVDERTVVVTIDGRDVSYAGESRESLQLAYAMSVHKSQGSEYDVVVIALHPSHYVLLNRSLLYTAITRAKGLVVLIASERAVKMAIDNTHHATRYGRLRERLLQARESSSL